MKNAGKIQVICVWIMTLLFLIGIIVCAICNLAISGAWTWSRISIAVIVFSWLILFPVVRYGRKGVVGSLISLTTFTIPFLYVLDQCIPAADMIMPIGIRITIIVMIFAWIIFALFQILKYRIFLAVAISLLLAILLCLAINLCLSIFFSQMLIDVWDILNVGVIALISVVFFGLDQNAQKKKI